MRVMDYLLRSIRDAALFNPEVQAAPHCILWPDRDHQWEPAVQRLLQEMPELFILGEYNPEKRTGPAIWLKCVVHLFGDRDNQKCDTPVSGYLVEKITVSQESFVPIIYLPGVSHQDLRAVEACPDNLKPLAELQYRGSIWSQINAKDWTILAFLKAEQGGLGLDVAQDSDIKRAIRTALVHLLDEDPELLQGKRAEDCARQLQQVWWDRYVREHVEEQAGSYLECCLFVDGLRFDCARRLQSLLEEKGLSMSRELSWAVLPSVTATGKPAVSPVAGLINAGEGQSENFEPCTAHNFRKLLQDNEWTVCRRNEPLPRASELNVKKLWLEFGDMDHEGHERGCKLAGHVERLLREIRDHVLDIVDAGWNSVRIVTDHGWLMLPGGLPKIELPKALTQTKWSRCAVIKPGADTHEKLYPWYWDTDRHFALADGISCFRKNDEYAHGGLSLQECLLLNLTAFAGHARKTESTVELTDVVWKGLRCTVAAEGEIQELWLDIRSDAGDAASSRVLNLKPFKKDGSASVIVEDEQLQGSEAFVVLLDTKGQLILQTPTIIGGRK